MRNINNQVTTLSSNGKQTYKFIHYHTRFSSEEGCGVGNSRKTWNTSQSTTISDNSAGSNGKIPALRCTSHEDGTKHGQRCNHTTWFLVDLWAAFPLAWSTRLTFPTFLGTYWSHGQSIVAGIVPFGKVTQYSGLHEFHRCEVSHHELCVNPIRCCMYLK